MAAVKVKFSKSYMLSGKEVDTIELREPLVKDMELVQEESNAVHSQNQLIRILSGLDTATNEEFSNMLYKDYVKIQTVLEGLTE